jgi:uncharacterized membrane protein (DUF373 family)
MLRILRFFERGIVVALIVMMGVAVLVSTLELAIILGQELLEPPRLLLNIRSMLEVFGFFFMILIGLELLETIKTYLSEDQIHVEIVFLVAMIAIARKVIILDLKSLSPPALLGIAAIILALAGGYYVVKLAHREGPSPGPGEQHESDVVRAERNQRPGAR